MLRGALTEAVRQETFSAWGSLTLQGLQTLARLDVPDLDGGVGVARDQDVVLQLHAAGERLVARQRVDTVARLHVPHSDGRVQRAAHHVDPVELERQEAAGEAQPQRNPPPSCG